MKEIHRSRRGRQPRRYDPTIRPGLTSDEDESDGDHRNLGRINKNANRTGTTATLMDTLANQQSSSLHLYSITSIPKKAAAATMSDDLTPLTSSATPLTSLTASTHTKQSEGTTVQIDLTLLSSAETLASSSITSDQELSQHRSSKHPVASPILSQTDTSMKSIAFNKENSVAAELMSFRKNISLPAINDLGDQHDASVIDSIATSSLQHSHRKSPVRWSPQRWYLDPTNNRLRVVIGCSSIGFIAGVLILLLLL